MKCALFQSSLDSIIYSILLNLGKQSPNLFSRPANVTPASLYPPMWSGFSDSIFSIDSSLMLSICEPSGFLLQEIIIYDLFKLNSPNNKKQFVIKQRFEIEIC